MALWALRSFLFALILRLQATAPPDKTIYIIRHGEKKWVFGCLSAAGQARAENLVSVFDGKPSEQHDTFAKPRSIFAHWYRDPIDCERCNQTVTPISMALNVPIDLSHGGAEPGAGPGGGNPGAAKAMLAALESTGGPVLAAWEHLNIHYLTRDLGVAESQIPKWSGSDYDGVYILNFDSSHKLKSFRRAAQNFNGGEQVV
eukprot:TRINITY_DN94562_c0_g1_i1.p1 TRINITY_DN94562_c0_g1~~TRINITY_DN94562_c0_g1_i1.p1  ORF type:complete len:216 (-),score=39.94 TRINITY_DN94562_c0_g1_i1:282-884(-)